MERPEKRVRDSEMEQAHILFPRYLNASGRLYGGQLLDWLDEMAGIVAQRHSGGEAVTVAIDNMDFKAGARNGDVVYIHGYVTWVGTTSMEVRLDSYVEDMETGVRNMINSAFFVMVAVDEDGHPRPVPALRVETVSERAELELGQKRQELRKQRRKEGY